MGRKPVLIHRSLGPGVVFILAVLGAGDIVDISVAGSHFGYNLMWALVLSAILRFTLLSTYARYQLLNPHGETLIDGYRRLGKPVATYILSVLTLNLILWSASNTIGAGCVLNLFFPRVSAGTWGVVAATTGFFLILAGGYKSVSRAFAPILVTMACAFVLSMILIKPDWDVMLKAGLKPWIPPGSGVFGGAFVASSVIGSLAGTPSSLFYASFLKEKGWIGREHRRMQICDLIIATLVMIAIDLAIWSTAAEALHPAGVKIREAKDIGAMLGKVIGPVGPVIFYLGLLAALCANLVGNTMGLSMAIAEIVTGNETTQKSGIRRRKRSSTRASIYRLCLVLGLASGLVATRSAIEFVPLLVAVMALQVPVMSILIAGLLVISNNRDWIGKGNTNRWYENLLLGVFLLVSVCFAFILCKDFVRV